MQKERPRICFSLLNSSCEQEHPQWGRQSVTSTTWHVLHCWGLKVMSSAGREQHSFIYFHGTAPTPPSCRFTSSALFCSIKAAVFSQQLCFLCVAFCCGHWEKSKCVLQRWTLEIVEKITPHTATLCQLLPHPGRSSPWHCLVGLILLLCSREGSAFMTPASSAVCVRPSYQSQEEENSVCFSSEWKTKAEMDPQKLPCSHQSKSLSKLPDHIDKIHLLIEWIKCNPTCCSGNGWEERLGGDRINWEHEVGEEERQRLVCPLHPVQHLTW